MCGNCGIVLTPWCVPVRLCRAHTAPIPHNARGGVQRTILSNDDVDGPIPDKYVGVWAFAPRSAFSLGGGGGMRESRVVEPPGRAPVRGLMGAGWEAGVGWIRW